MYWEKPVASHGAANIGSFGDSADAHRWRLSATVAIRPTLAQRLPGRYTITHREAARTWVPEPFKRAGPTKYFPWNRWHIPQIHCQTAEQVLAVASPVGDFYPPRCHGGSNHLPKGLRLQKTSGDKRTWLEGKATCRRETIRWNVAKTGTLQNNKKAP